MDEYEQREFIERALQAYCNLLSEWFKITTRRNPLRFETRA
jgi:hypothetical protein